MRVLILTCNTGEGHNSCAAALRETFQERGTACDVADALGFLSEGMSRFISRWHTRIYRHFPDLFRWGYAYVERHPALLRERSAVHRFFTSGAGRLYPFLREGAYDTVICVHVFAAFMVEVLLKEHPGMWQTAFLATDYTCSPSGSEHALDWYFIPDESLAEEFIRSGIAPEKLAGTGIPVRRDFQKRGDREAARRALGLPADAPHLMVMCGSMGCGPIPAIVECLARDLPAHSAVSVVCGTNGRLRASLERRFRGDGRIRVLGYVKEISLLMDSADLYLTKPGGISVTEAAAKALPMAFIDAVAGCEAYNMRYFMERGGAVTADTPARLAENCVRLLSDGERLAAMSRKLEALGVGQAGERICRVLTGETTCALK